MRYPEATWKGDGQSGGSYVGKPFRVVLHTTETAGVPGYGNGATAPHITYVPKTRRWVQHTDFNTAARALRNVSGGVQTNRANALQVELVCYSAKNIADQSSSRLWVGDLTDDHYLDLRNFLSWTYDAFDVASTWPEKQAFSSREANASGFRMTGTEWNEFDGVCAHQHVPENTHWDTGALDWTKLMEEGADMPLSEADLDAIRQTVREELDRQTDGKPGDANSFYGVGQRVVTTLIGRSGRNVGYFLQKTFEKVSEPHPDHPDHPTLGPQED